MGNNAVSSTFLCLCKDLFGRIKCNKDTLYRLVRITQHQADIVPLFCQAECRNLIKSLKQVFYCHFSHLTPKRCCQIP